MNTPNLTSSLVVGCALLFSAVACGNSSSSSSTSTGSTAGMSAGGGGSGGTDAVGTSGTGGSPMAGSAGTGAGAAGETAMAGTGGAGGAGGDGAGGSAGEAAYNPCPDNGDPCAIMALGDSITWGVGSSDGGSYRNDLFHLALQNQKNITFVGSGENGPAMVDGVAFPRYTEGHSGWTIDDGGGRDGLYPEIIGWLTNTPPHIITLMIGTNDVNIELDLDNAGTRLELLIDRIAETSPDALIVVAQIVPTTNDTTNQRVVTFNNRIPAIVEARATDGMHIIMVDMYTAYTDDANYKTSLMNDELHPNDAGYVVMGDVWWEAIGDLLPDQ